MREHAAALLAVLTRPFIAKIGLGDSPDVEASVSELVNTGVELIHINLGDATSPPGLAAIGRLKRIVPLLIAGGRISSAEQAQRAIAAGADAVAVGSAAMKDPGLCGRLQAALRQTTAHGVSREAEG